MLAHPPNPRPSPNVRLYMRDRSVAASDAKAGASLSSARRISRNTVPSMSPTVIRQSNPLPSGRGQLAAKMVCTAALRYHDQF
jgi:hypothetical protein